VLSTGKMLVFFDIAISYNIRTVCNAESQIRSLKLKIKQEAKLSLG